MQNTHLEDNMYLKAFKVVKKGALQYLKYKDLCHSCCPPFQAKAMSGLRTITAFSMKELLPSELLVFASKKKTVFI